MIEDRNALPPAEDGDQEKEQKSVKPAESSESNASLESLDSLRATNADLCNALASAQPSTEDETETPSMTKAEVQILLEGIITRLKDDEREKYSEVTEEELEANVASMRTVIDVLKKASPDRVAKDDHDFLSRFVASSLQLSVEIAAAGFREEDWRKLTSFKGAMPPASPEVRDRCQVLREAMQKVCAILQKKLGIQTIPREDLRDILLRIQDHKDVIRDVFPQELTSIKESDPSAFAELSAFGERVKALDDTIAGNLPPQADRQMAVFYLIFCIKLRTILMAEMANVKRSIRGFAEAKLLAATERAAVEMDALFPETGKEQRNEEPEDESFGLEGEGPFDREELERAIILQSRKIPRSTGVRISRSPVLKNVKRLCPARIEKLSEVSHFMHWQRGVADAIGTIPTNRRSNISSVLLTLYNPILERIGQRFGVEGMSLDRECLNSIAERSDNILTAQEIVDVVTRSFDFASRELKEVIAKAVRDDAGIPNLRLSAEIQANLQLIVNVLSEEVGNQFPTGIASPDELWMLDGWFSEYLFDVIDESFKGHETQNRTYARLEKSITAKYWNPSLEHFRRCLTGGSPEQSAQPLSSPENEQEPSMTPSKCMGLYAAAMQDIAPTPKDAQALENLFASDEGEACIEAYSVFEKLLAPHAPLSKDDLDRLPQDMRDVFTAFTDALREADPHLGSRIADLYKDVFSRFQESVTAHFSSSAS